MTMIAHQPNTLSNTSGPSHGMLSNLRNTVFDRSKFIDQSINANTIDNSNYNLGPKGLDILRQHISLDASHDANRVNKPECSPETRTRILKELFDWLDDPKAGHQIVWLHGPAGAGKSAIAQTTMKRARREGRLGASFFFSRGAAGRSSAERLFPTIAYQLATNVPELAPSVEKVMNANQDLPLRDLETQFEQLIDHPARECNLPVPYPLVGIDGIDECDDEVVQEKFLTIIGESVKSQSPLRFLISSRPEPRIRALFTIKLHDYTRNIVLETSDESLDDVSRYLRVGFADISQRQSHFLRDIRQPWPSEHDLRVLRDRSSGHFIYAATVLKFVGGNDYLSPIKQLNIILRQSPEMTAALRASPYPELDQLYHQVLSTHPNPSQLCQILTFFVTPEFAPFPDLLDDLLNFDRGTVIASLRCMHSLLKFSESDSRDKPSVFHHASFREFLLDSSRSQHFHINGSNAAEQTAKICVDSLVRWIREASQSDLQDFFPDVIQQNPIVRFYLSKRQISIMYICTYLGNYSNAEGIFYSDIRRLLTSIPHKPVVPLKPILFILIQLCEVLKISKSSNLWIYEPRSRVHKAFKAYLSDEHSSTMRFLTSPPCLFAIDYLPLDIIAKCYGMDSSSWVQEYYPFLKSYTPGRFPEPRIFPRNGEVAKYSPFNIQFSEYVKDMAPFKQYLQDSTLKEDSEIAIAGQVLRLLSREKAGNECWDLSDTVMNMSARVLRENAENVLLYLTTLKTRVFVTRERIGISRLATLDCVLHRLAAVLDYDLARDADIVAMISREVLYVTKDSPPIIKIHPCFLCEAPFANLIWFAGAKSDNMKSLSPPSYRDCLAHLSNDFQYFVSRFTHLIFRFLMDSRRAGEFFIPRDILHKDLLALQCKIIPSNPAN